MKTLFRRKPRLGLCRLGCEDVELDRRGLVKDHYPWYQGGRRRCYGSGQTPKAGA